MSRLASSAVMATLLVLSGAGRAQDQWQSWEGCEKLADGVWQWKAGQVSHFVSLEQFQEGVAKITVSPDRPTVTVAAEGEVSAGAVQVKGVPPLVFQFQAGKLRCVVPAKPGERFFGLGEKYNAVDQRGKRVNMWVDDGWRSLGDRTYLPVPMYVSSAKYGLYLDSPRHSVFDMASEPSPPAPLPQGEGGPAPPGPGPAAKGETAQTRKVASSGPAEQGGQVVITLDAPSMTLYVFAGSSYAELLRQYCQITGLPEAPPEWAFGIWLSRSSYDTQQEVLQVARRWRALELPLAVFNVEGWKGGRWLTFDKQRFPDPRGMIQQLHEYGCKVMLWNTHNLPPEDPNYKYGDERGYFVKGLDGKTYNIPEGYGRGGCLDVTNPEAVRWWTKLYDPLLDMGVDALFNDITNYLDDDFGNQRAGRMVFANGKTSEDMHNLYWMLFNQATYEYMKRKTGNDTVLRVAGGWAGQQKYSTVWAGDSATTWEFMQRDLRALLSMGWSGIPYFGYDIPGYSATGNPPTKELYMRWVEFGALSPLMQFHTTARPEPWHYGDEAIAVVRIWGWIREYLRPYLYSLALEAQETGAPMARSLAWHYPDDPVACGVEDQFLLGSELLVAPVLTPGTQRRIYLPQGTWVDIFDGSTYEGPAWIEAQAPLDQVPILARQGAIYPCKLSGELTLDPIMQERHVKVLEIWPPPDRSTSSIVWRRKGGSARVRCSRHGDEITLTASKASLPAGTVLRFEVGPPQNVKADGDKLKELSEDDLIAGEKPGWFYRKDEQVCFVQAGQTWEKVTLTEKHGQLRFMGWAAPARIPANAGRMRVEVSLPELKPGTTPVLGYQYLEAPTLVSGQPCGKDRWAFEVPLQVAPTDQEIRWSVKTEAKTGESIMSRDRITVVEVPARVMAPEAVRLGATGAIRATVVSYSDFPTRGRLTIAGPGGMTFTPQAVDYALRGRGARREFAFNYRAVGEFGLGEHPITLRHTIGNTQMPDTTILAARPFSWHVVGPFPEGVTLTNWQAGFRAVHPPEQGEVDLAAQYDTPAGKVKWQAYPVEAIADDGMIDIERLCGKVDLANAYLFTSFESPAAREVLLKVGSDDALMLWVNGLKVFEFDGGRPAKRDQDSVKVTLKAGRNTILAKVFDLMDAWRFYLRVTGADGKPVGDFRP